MLFLDVFLDQVMLASLVVRLLLFFIYFITNKKKRFSVFNKDYTGKLKTEHLIQIQNFIQIIVAVSEICSAQALFFLLILFRHQKEEFY